MALGCLNSKGKLCCCCFVPKNETRISVLNLSVIIVDYVSFFSCSNILGDWGLSPHFITRDFNMIPGQKGGQRWDNLSAKIYEKRKVLIFSYFWLPLNSVKMDA